MASHLGNTRAEDLTRMVIAKFGSVGALVHTGLAPKARPELSVVGNNVVCTGQGVNRTRAGLADTGGSPVRSEGVYAWFE